MKYFGGEEHEGARYRAAVRDYQALEFKVISMFGLTLLCVSQSLHDTSSLSKPSEPGPKLHHRNC